MKDSNPFLSAVMRKVRAGRPRLELSEPFFTRLERVPRGNYVEVWFLTSGCSWDARGGCTMCNYGAGPRALPPQFMQQAVARALAELPVEPAELMVSPSGGMLDEREVPRLARTAIFQEMSRSKSELLMIETRAETATAARLQEFRDAFPDRALAIEFGLESSSPWISEFCVNKGAEPERFVTAAAAARARKIAVYANVCVGTAFLSEREAVEDAVQTARWAWANGASRVVLFPLHVKRFTLLHELHQAGRYAQTSLWTLVECLHRLGPGNSHRLEIAWYKTYYTQESKATFPPTTCAQCVSQVVEQLDRYRQTLDFAVVEELAAFPCPCREQWQRGLCADEPLPLSARVGRAYEFLGSTLLPEGADDLAIALQRLHREPAPSFSTHDHIP